MLVRPTEKVSRKRATSGNNESIALHRYRYRFFYFSQITCISHESVCCFNHGLVLTCCAMCIHTQILWPIATAGFWLNEDTAPMAQLDLLLKSEGSEKDQCFAVGILAFQKPRNRFHWLRSIQTTLAGLSCSQMLLLNIFTYFCDP